MPHEFAVIGAGINGMMTALELSRHSERVILIDAAGSGRGCSWSGGGILFPLTPWREHASNLALCLAGQTMYAEICAALLETTGIDPEYRESGLLLVDCEDIETPRAWCAAHGIAAQTIGVQEHDSFAAVRFRSPGDSLFLPDVAQVRNPRLLQAMKACLQQQGVTLRELWPVHKLAPDGGQVRCDSDQDSIVAEQVILCTGAWLNQLLPEPDQLGIRPVRGQMLCLKDHALDLDQIVMRQDCYAIPRQGRVLLIGSTVEDAGFDAAVTGEARRQLLEAARQFLPGLDGESEIQQWSGLRPDPGRGYPYIGRLPDMQRVYVNAGHFRTGLLTAPVSARMLAAELTGGTPQIDIADYLP